MLQQIVQWASILGNPDQFADLLRLIAGNEVACLLNQPGELAELRLFHQHVVEFVAGQPFNETPDGGIGDLLQTVARGGAGQRVQGQRQLRHAPDVVFVEVHNAAVHVVVGIHETERLAHKIVERRVGKRLAG